MSDPMAISKSTVVESNICPKQEATIERATVCDVDCIKHLVASAYSKYVERIGKEPAPMTEDYHAIMQTKLQDIFVLRASQNGRALGSIVLADHEEDDAMEVRNVVVDPTAQGSGYGRQLLQFAEDTARAKGREAITLFTNEKMFENIAMYPRLGFVETGRREEDGYHRVYFCKRLSAP